MIRCLVISQTYRMASQPLEPSESCDQQNFLLHPMNTGLTEVHGKSWQTSWLDWHQMLKPFSEKNAFLRFAQTAGNRLPKI